MLKYYKIQTKAHLKSRFHPETFFSGNLILNPKTGYFEGVVEKDSHYGDKPLLIFGFLLDHKMELFKLPISTGKYPILIFKTFLEPNKTVLTGNVFSIENIGFPEGNSKIILEEISLNNTEELKRIKKILTATKDTIKENEYSKNAFFYKLILNNKKEFIKKIKHDNNMIFC